MNPMTLDGVLALQEAGAQILDTRDPGEFAAAHLAGSINIGLGGQYATWAGTVLDREHPIVIIADPGRENEAATRLGRIGFDHVAGYLQDGLHSLESRPGPDRHNRAPQRAVRRGAACHRPSRRWPSTCARRASASRSASPAAWAFRSIIWRGNLEKLPKDRPLLVYCAGGYRSSIAASLLQRRGFPPVSEIAGGIAAWEAAKLPLGGVS